MIEYSPRESHNRVYTKNGVKIEISVDNMGMVLLSEELLDHLIIQTGYVEEVK